MTCPLMPLATAGQAIGILGGSFDPAHAGHVHISHEALRRFGLDQVWWLVSPANPLKSRGPAPMDSRLARARQVLGHAPRIHVTDLEVGLGTRHTYQTVARLQACRPRVRFVWLMGADNLAELHLWKSWDVLAQQVPMGILARPGDRMAARHSVAARRFRAARLPEAQAGRLARMPAPAWCLVNIPMRMDSSTGLRAAGQWVSQG
ncbi:hypothetical protein LCGC14_2091030 [marine sediment metagenome]|uniref:Cytidyltransferase-like domain-containing protein n=1 Tax=marine sediment metagenome TaxID=412755 RepID=A0A0F9F043_9ZZZZ